MRKHLKLIAGIVVIVLGLLGGGAIAVDHLMHRHNTSLTEALSDANYASAKTYPNSAAALWTRTACAPVKSKDGTPIGMNYTDCQDKLKKEMISGMTAGSPGIVVCTPKSGPATIVDLLQAVTSSDAKTALYYYTLNATAYDPADLTTMADVISVLGTKDTSATISLGKSATKEQAGVVTQGDLPAFVSKQCSK